MCSSQEGSLGADGVGGLLASHSDSRQRLAINVFFSCLFGLWGFYECLRVPSA